MMDTERRITPVVVEVRAGKADSRTIGGYAAKFNTYSQNLGGFIERIDPRAFNKSAGMNFPGVQARYNHDDNMLLGTSDAGTLRLALDEIGLEYEVDLPQARADVLELVQRGDVRKSSFAMMVPQNGGDDWTTSDEGFPLRTILTCRLMDVAPVNSPAYEDTSTEPRAMALRSLATKFDAPIEDVRALAEANNLLKLFKRTDVAPEPRRSPRAKLASIAHLL